MQFYNVHSHVFNIRNAPKKFLNLFLPDFAAYLVDRLTNTDAGSAMFQVLLSKLGGNLGKRYASFLQVGKSRNQREIFENLKKQYDDDPHLKIVALTMYMEKCGAGPSDTGYEGQLEGIIEIKKENPDNLLVFLGIDPRWKATGKELKETVERYFETKVRVNAERSVYPFAGLKIYPSLGFYAFDEKLKDTFEWAAENEVPVLTHCSYLGGIYNNDTRFVNESLDPVNAYTGLKYSETLGSEATPPSPDKSINILKWIFGQNDNNRNLNTCSYFLEPESYRSLLEYFKNKTKPLKICLAHFGGDEHVLNESKESSSGKLFGTLQKNWCAQIKNLIREFPESVYTDISFTVGNPDTHKPFFKDLKDPELQNRIMFGTDFFLTERLLPEKDDYATFKKAALAQPFGNTNAWEIMASKNVESFLASKYNP
ncbi:amidohydrolase family protein [Dyadobacter chenwenxiniae]|uniref:Amidohydrolase family protein n=2 Tax=Dyadobacter chenwenxiniae TaxID=2906456 RepID=A0A9X1PG80_9BACT|nr:amidohydrolase family protein [Dyadobacter chenwenxiniae]MCF0060570.1 amidohydrolase family protein [Dyadobacter chenwenxiniae]UON86301.1 amidohydrolase family protein [Dyadobacter chenwenxiniae]